MRLVSVSVSVCVCVQLLGECVWEGRTVGGGGRKTACAPRQSLGYGVRENVGHSVQLESVQLVVAEVSGWVEHALRWSWKALIFDTPNLTFPNKPRRWKGIVSCLWCLYYKRNHSHCAKMKTILTLSLMLWVRWETMIQVRSVAVGWIVSYCLCI